MDRQLQWFRESGGALRMSEFIRLGGHRSDLVALCKRGEIERIERGLYVLAKDVDRFSSEMVLVSRKNPQGILCLISALSIHEVTLQIPHFVYLAVPQNYAKRKNETIGIKHHWYSEKMLSTGIEMITHDGVDVPVFNLEKTLVDCIKFRNKIGLDIGIEALRMSWQKNLVDLDKLYEYAKMFGVLKFIQPIMETIMSA